MKGMLYVKPVYGLANRLRTVAAALALAKKTDRRLCVFWYDLPDCHVRWRDILKVPADFDVQEVDASETDPFASLFSKKNPQFYPQTDSKRLILDCQKGKAGVLTHENFKPFYDAGAYGWLIPVDDVSRELNAIRSEIGPNVVGVHIRRTDNMEAIFLSPTSMFKDRLAEEIAHDPSVRFFLATDDESEKDEICRTFPGKVFVRENVASRFSDGGIRDALIDLLLLAATRKIYGTFWSSFSREAAKIGNCELIVVNDESKFAVTVFVQLENSAYSLGRCLDALLKQWLFRIEVVCIDGGASAKMKAVVSEYRRKDARIRSVADVPQALRSARGKYAFFMRSNDVARNNLTKVLFEFSEVRNLDAVVFRANQLFGTDPNAELADRLNRRIVSAFDWKPFQRRVFPGSLVRLLVGCSAAPGLPVANSFCRTERLVSVGKLQLGSEDFGLLPRVGVIVSSLSESPVWSGNAESLEKALGDGKTGFLFRSRKWFLWFVFKLAGMVLSR